MTRLTTLLAAACMLLAGAATAESQPFIQVIGEAQVAAKPDMARIDVGVIEQAETAQAALEKNNRAMRRLSDTLKKHGVADRDIQTRSFDVSPVYDYGEDRRRERLQGYRVSNQVQVRVRDLGRLGALLDALVGAGANRVGGIVFDVQDAQALLDAGRREAVQEARRRAGLYAETAGVNLGDLLLVEEMDGGAPRPVAMRMSAEQAVPIAEGEVEFGVRLRLRYAVVQ